MTSTSEFKAVEITTRMSSNIQEEDGSVVVLNCEWMTNLKEKIEKTPMKDARVERATIFRVPKNIRTSDTYGAIFRVPENTSPAGDTYGEAFRLGDAYDPKIVSLGPYHRGKPSLQEWDNRLKWPSLKKFLQRSRDKTRAMENCIKKIKELESEARSEYAEEVKMTSNEFVEMMLLDCCFVLELLVELWLEQEEEKEREEEEKLHKKMEEKKTIVSRLISVFKKKPEKQKPSAPAVSSSDPEAVTPKQSSKEEKHPREERTLIQQWKWAKPLITNDLLMLENQIPLRLLRELHSIVLGHDNAASMNNIIVSFFKQFSLTFNIKVIPAVSCHHLLHLYHSYLIPEKQQPTVREVPDDIAQVMKAPTRSRIPYARDLINSQVDIKKQKDTSSNFLDLRFDYCHGRLEIPMIHVDDETNTLLRNLIAFEQCYPTISHHLSTYAWFMDSVIDNSADVALLRRQGVLVSWLGSDEEVARLFNSLCKEVIVDPKRCYLEKTIKEVTKYCDNRFHRCCAILNHSYFSNPWASISVVAAIILFVLTFLQTLYSICDSCYSL